MRLNKIDPVSFGILLAIFEGIALLFLALGSPSVGEVTLIKRLVGGFILGFATALCASLIYNQLSRWIPLKVKIGNNSDSLKSLKLINIAIANGIFLGVLFFVEPFVSIYPSNGLGNAALGFTMVFVALLICKIPYDLFARLKKYGVRGKLSSSNFYLKSIPLRFALFGGLIEAVILPILNGPGWIQNYILDSALKGFVAGLVAPIIIITIYNLIVKYHQRLALEIQ